MVDTIFIVYTAPIYRDELREIDSIWSNFLLAEDRANAINLERDADVTTIEEWPVDLQPA